MVSSNSAAPGSGLRVLIVAPEVSPFRKTGGLADVAGALPPALAQLGCDARVVTPLYAGSDWNALERLDGRISVPTYHGPTHAGVRMGTLPGSDVRCYFVEYHRFFDRPFPYGPPGDAYPDNLERFSFFSRAALELSKSIGFHPDVIHAHDWQTALVPVYANTVEWGGPLYGTPSVFSIHNLAYQGVHDPGGLFITGLGPEHYNDHELEHFGALNLMKSALHHATLLSTVSAGYSREIQTPAYGCGLDGVLRARSGDLVGIRNGIDVDEWNPKTDRYLAANFSADDLSGKRSCKLALQREMGLPERADVPLMGVVGRLTPQKGFDVLAACLPELLSGDVQMVLLGSGDADAEHYFGQASHHGGERFRAYIGFDNALAHRIEAGCDLFLMPSRFEPCGLNQMYSLRYGTLPVVRRTGGLADTVESYDPATGHGNGFCFDDLTPEALRNTIEWAAAVYRERPDHFRKMMLAGMQSDWSWPGAAREYEKLYRRAYRQRRGHEFTPR